VAEARRQAGSVRGRQAGRRVEACVSRQVGSRSARGSYRRARRPCATARNVAYSRQNTGARHASAFREYSICRVSAAIE